MGPWALVSSQLVSKCQTLTCIQLHGHVGMSGSNPPQY